MINDDGQPALKACALTCTNFRNRSQRHLFYSVDILCSINSSTVLKLIRLYECLEESAHISGYIRELHLTGIWSDLIVLNHPIFPKLLRMVHSVSVFELSGNCHNTRYLSWDKMNAETQIELHKILSSLAITRIALSKIYLPKIYAKYLLHIPSVTLDSLLLTNSGCNSIQEPEPLPDINMDSRRLNCLTISNVNVRCIFPLVEQLSPQSCKLEKLIMANYDLSSNIFSPEMMMNTAGEIVRKQKDSLTALELPRSRFWEDFEKDDALCVPIQTLSEIRKGNGIQELSFEIYYKDIDKFKGFISNGQSWNSFDELLSSPWFPNLKMVNIILTTFTTGFMQDEEYGYLQSLLEQLLCATKRKGILHVTNGICDTWIYVRVYEQDLYNKIEVFNYLYFHCT
ncbi:hypothetical protein BDQ17DRAFT_1413938 [Cyathus striatus]|nr:hypothetical protein BDQ17DRAFT_1413938 [Cyathus striatus]